MGFSSIVRKLRRKEKEARILLLGLDNAGKTTIVRRLFAEDVGEVAPTLGFSVRTIELEGLQVSIWDIGGQKSLRSYWRNYFESTDGLVWVVDSTDRRRLEDCRVEFDALLVEERLAGASVLVLANKQDVEGSLSSAEIAEALDLARIKTRHWHIAPCSALSSSGVSEAFSWLVQDISSRVYLLD